MQTFPKRLLLLGSGELGKELGIAAKRLGCTLIACDRYENAPAMQVADKSEIFDMTNPSDLRDIISKNNPDIIIPEIESIAVEVLQEFELKGLKVIPNARATSITMNRDQIRNLAAKDLGLRTAKFGYASTCNELKEIAKDIGMPVFVKPIMSSSGKGQSFVETYDELEKAWENAIKGARGKSSRVIVEEFIEFELEITLLTIRQRDGTTLFCPPIGHQQENGDYQCSWQPAEITKELLKQAQEMAEIITTNLGGVGLFGVEFFISGKEVIFSELSPRPHDTGLVTLISQNLSEFELHLRAILDIPIPEINCLSPSASRVILAKDDLKTVSYQGIENSLKANNTQLLIFGKPNCKAGRRMGVALAKAENIILAQAKADQAEAYIEIFEGKTNN